MDEPKKIYIDDYMSDEDEDDETTTNQPKMDRRQYEENKSKFDIKKLISNFILK